MLLDETKDDELGQLQREAIAAQITGLWEQVLQYGRELPLKRCVGCGSEEGFWSVEVDETVTLDGKAYSGVIPASRCKACNEVYFSGPALEMREYYLEQELKQLENPGAEAQNFLRKAAKARELGL